ncbi:MAG: YceI family protein [Phycisphaerales bacterium]
MALFDVARRMLVPFGGVSVAALAIASAVVLSPSGAQPAAVARAQATGVFSVDNTHSSLLFRVKYFDSSHFFGRFNTVSGSYRLDAENLGESFLELTVDVASVDTGADRRDQHLRNADFFNAGEFPNATFKSTKVESIGENKFRVTGDFTLRGITKSITTDLEVVGSTTDPRSNAQRMGFLSEFKINRSDFEVNYGIPAMSDETTVIVSLTGLERS